MTFGERLQELRKEKGLSQEKLAEKIGVSRQAMAKWESGQTYPEIDKLILLSDLFRISIDKLVRDDSGGNCLIQTGKRQDTDVGEAVGFLLRANKSTYAGKGPEAAPSRPASHDYVYAENDLNYIDTYLGGENFAGEIALWRRNVPFWSMNYCGRVLSESFSGDFLKECLLLATEEYPYRGPLVHENGDFRYHSTVSGTFDWFSGYEEIFCSRVKVYECVFHGGSLK